MERRIVLKQMGLSLGYVVATPTLIGLVQSCKQEKAITWVPGFFSPEQGGVLTELVDIILPKTDTPSASELKVDVFVDKFINEVLDPQEQDFIRMTMGKFLDKALLDTKKEKVQDLGAPELEQALTAALKIPEDTQKSYEDAIAEYAEANLQGQPAVLDDAAARFGFADKLRGLTILGYKASEYVGEQVLAYLPVPGEYIGCTGVQELTGGKAWSL